MDDRPLSEYSPLGSEVKDPNPKDAAGSARIDYALMDPVAVGEMCLAMEEGGTKYGYFNYTVAPVKSRVYIGAAFRHLFKWLMGEDRDEKTGVHHLGSVMACCMIVLSAQSRGTLIDNRPPSLKGASSRIDGFEARVKKVREVFAGFSPRHYTIEDSQHVKGPGESPHRSHPQEAADKRT